MTTTDPRTAIHAAAPKPESLSGSSSPGGHIIPETHLTCAAGGQDSPQAISGTVPSPKSPAGSTGPLNGQDCRDAHMLIAAEGRHSPQANSLAMPKHQPPAGSTAAPPASDPATPIRPSPEGHETSRSHHATDTQGPHAAAADIPGCQPTPVDQASCAAGDQGPPAAIAHSTPTGAALLADPLLALAADVLDDLEKVRIANENRLRQLTRTGLDADGLERGFGLDETHPDVARLAALVGMLAEAEHKAALNLQRVMRGHPLGPWVKATTGIGQKQGARLIAAIGDPYWNTLHDRPRTVSELWAYCGYHVVPAAHMSNDTHTTVGGGELNGSDPGQARNAAQVILAGVAPKRQRGQKANWSATAKMRAYLAAESCMKQRESPYRAAYDTARVKYAEAAHGGECARCGPRNNPAKPGSPLSEGHKHARALRAVAKEILRDLWREARALHAAN